MNAAARGVGPIGLRKLIAPVLGLLFTSAALAAAPVVTTSASVRVFRDTNVFMQDEAPRSAGQAEPALPARENATGIDAALAVTSAWRRGQEAALELSYTPEAFRYLDHGSENHTDHTFAASAFGKAGPWSGEMRARYLATDGSKESPIYNGLGGAPAIGGEPVRARRQQAVARVAGKITRDFADGFMRGVFSLYDQDFHTRESTAAGYTNYVDRNETSGGFEAGWRVRPGFALVGGVRTGFQRQANLLGVAMNYSNTFTRWLGGIEGNVTPTLKLTLLAGPDVRHYGHSVRSSFEREQRTSYAEASGTWTPTSVDAVTLSARHYLWVPSGGRGAYVDTVADLGWKRKLAGRWTSSLGGIFHEGDSGRFNSAAPRHDRIYTLSAGASRAFASKLRLDFDVLHDWGLSLLPNTPARDYTRWIFSATVTRSW